MNLALPARLIGPVALLSLFACGAPPRKADPASAARYEASWESLTRHEVPEWLQDAKFGIYAHWGPYSVPAFGHEWYGMRMYDPSNVRGIYEHHMQTYGGPLAFGYREFIPRFKAERFDPQAWADLVRRSGAKYAGIAVVHHDGFLLWDSDVNRWNAGEMGPERDLFGELASEIRAVGLQVIATFHHIRTFNWYLPQDPAAVERGKQEGWDLFDPEYADLYWNEHTGKKEDFVAEWRAKVTEVIDKYSPDVLWFDGGQFQEEAAQHDVQNLLAYYYNSAEEKGLHVEVLNKLPTSMQFNFPEEFGMLTFEAGRDRPDVVERPWVDDEKIGLTSWGYVDGLEYRDANELIDALCDRVARGGGMLLSLSPKADGTIPQGQQDLLLAIGGWLDQNGEAIYGTRRWTTHAEGAPGKFVSDSGGHRRWRFVDAAASDIRFTQNGDALYAIALEWPADGRLEIKTLAAGGPTVESVELLGAAGDLEFEQGPGGLSVELPAEPPNDFAYALRLGLAAGSQ